MVTKISYKNESSHTNLIFVCILFIFFVCILFESIQKTNFKHSYARHLGHLNVSDILEICHQLDTTEHYNYGSRTGGGDD